jgi:hypothetical protein
MPTERAVRQWAMDETSAFYTQYARAREVGYHKMADDILDMADDGRNDWEERQNKRGETFVALNREAVERSKLRVDTRKWLLSKALPKLYGDKIEANHKVDASGAFLEMLKVISHQSAAAV